MSRSSRTDRLSDDMSTIITQISAWKCRIINKILFLTSEPHEMINRSHSRSSVLRNNGWVRPTLKTDQSRKYIVIDIYCYRYIDVDNCYRHRKQTYQEAPVAIDVFFFSSNLVIALNELMRQSTNNFKYIMIYFFWEEYRGNLYSFLIFPHFFLIFAHFRHFFRAIFPLVEDNFCLSGGKSTDRQNLEEALLLGTKNAAGTLGRKSHNQPSRSSRGFFSPSPAPSAWARGRKNRANCTRAGNN